MALALILSSYVAATAIGGGAQQLVLAAHGIEPLLVPTVIYGRSPARNAHGRPTEPELFAGLLSDVEAEGRLPLVRLVLTGYFASPEQVEAAAQLIERLRARPGDRVLVLVDPVMGDAPDGLYVQPAVARAVATRLVPLADWITPNIWELAYISNLPTHTMDQALAAARTLAQSVLVTSVPVSDDEIGLLCVPPSGAALIAHERAPLAPNGTGDLVSASFAAFLLKGHDPTLAARYAGGVVLEAVIASVGDNLPVVALGERLITPLVEVRTVRI